jgi:two-component system CheB/CheR fusion protein
MLKKRNVDIAVDNPFRIVCVGASAGGLEALIAFFKVLPQNINMAFVLIQHLEPHHKSALADILSRETPLIIHEAKNNLKLKPAHVYVITPNTLMAISRRRLKISTRTKRTDGRYLPIDFFMASLAQEEKEDAIGIILSGTGLDGTQGAKAIKAKGGIVFVQNEKTARYFGMPQSAIAAGLADFVMAPGDIARKIAHLEGLRHNRLFKKAVKGKDRQNDFKHLLVLLRDLTGVDFIHYKEATVSRRIIRRMAFHNIKDHAGYYDYLKKNPVEADLLRKDILIPVTSFFRDPEIFAALRKKVFPCIIDKRSPQNPVRLWVGACSSGEEVYSLAIFLYEFFEERKIKPYIQVFGTDLSEVNIERARAGLYTQGISSNVSAERLRKFFIKTEAGYKIAKYIRDFCVFAKHDITIDPPLSNMDIVSCRNLLIYLDGFLQNKALSMLHYALKPKGFLVLGAAESVAAVPGLFTAVDKKQKIYSKNIVPRKAIIGPGMPVSAQAKTGVKPRKTVKKLLLKHGPAERLSVISEEKDTINEELKAANEEIQSSNEELQSMNEELETSKEELQSTNEELVTLNEELQNKNTELTHLNSDLSNVFSSTNIPIIIVGNDLRIKRFTPTARKVMNLIPTDVDRPIGDIRLNIDIAGLEAMILDVIDDMAPKESEVKDKEGRWYSVRIRPYRTIDNKIDGAIISLVDIDAIKRSREEAQGALEYSQAIIETIREPLVVLDKDARVLSVNKSFCDTFRSNALIVKGKFFYELGAREWNDPGLRNYSGRYCLKRAILMILNFRSIFPE